MLNKKYRIKKGDTVMVIAGKEKSKSGKLLEIRKNDSTLLVEGLNIVKRHIRAKGNESGTIQEKEAPIHVSNVMLLCAKCNKPVRSSIKILEDKKKIRVCTKCGESFDN